jgi:hypothetical protein
MSASWTWCCSFHKVREGEGASCWGVQLAAAAGRGGAGAGRSLFMAAGSSRSQRQQQQEAGHTDAVTSTRWGARWGAAGCWKKSSSSSSKSKVSSAKGGQQQERQLAW